MMHMVHQYGWGGVVRERKRDEEQISAYGWGVIAFGFGCDRNDWGVTDWLGSKMTPAGWYYFLFFR